MPNSLFPDVSGSDARLALRERYLDLVNRILPEAAASRRWPVRFDHCFARIVLDHTFGKRWYDALDRKKGPAYKQLTAPQLERAIAHAEAMLNGPDDTAWSMNQRSLEWRGKT